MPLPALGLGMFAAFGVALKWLVPAVVTWVVVSLGLGYVTYIGVQFILDQGIDFINDRIIEIPVDLVQYLDLMGLYDAVSILSGGVTASIAIKALGGFKGLKRKFTPGSIF